MTFLKLNITTFKFWVILNFMLKMELNLFSKGGITFMEACMIYLIKILESKETENILE